MFDLDKALLNLMVLLFFPIYCLSWGYDFFFCKRKCWCCTVKWMSCRHWLVKGDHRSGKYRPIVTKHWPISELFAWIPINGQKRRTSMVQNYYSYVWQIGKGKAETQPSKRQEWKEWDGKQRESLINLCVSTSLHLQGGLAGLSTL